MELPGIKTRRPSEIIRETSGELDRLEARLLLHVRRLDERIRKLEDRLNDD